MNTTQCCTFPSLQIWNDSRKSCYFSATLSPQPPSPPWVKPSKRAYCLEANKTLCRLPSQHTFFVQIRGVSAVRTDGGSCCRNRCVKRKEISPKPSNTTMFSFSSEGLQFLQTSKDNKQSAYAATETFKIHPLTTPIWHATVNFGLDKNYFKTGLPWRIMWFVSWHEKTKLRFERWMQYLIRGTITKKAPLTMEREKDTWIG